MASRETPSPVTAAASNPVREYVAWTACFASHWSKGLVKRVRGRAETETGVIEVVHRRADQAGSTAVDPVSRRHLLPQEP